MVYFLILIGILLRITTHFADCRIGFVWWNILKQTICFNYPNHRYADCRLFYRLLQSLYNGIGLRLFHLNWINWNLVEK
ncbi:MAG: hypothetical protein Athens101428_381 [Candidatus Berkelbacteria bacterium Athens1014_28]|uniref:Uncharacterized protein n=1 Tax=Candidatus Berkelbacteria bacterium Athens1014_28 TaxID=2017145 RepID=A0A554LN39_9BACT|nr:MAG: hypothetical protein Athens101428_381 [Candidatus Berkelbacteria bacterium Athens1014_28]